MTAQLDKNTIENLINGVTSSFDFGGVQMAVKFGSSKNIFPYNNNIRSLPVVVGSGLKRGVMKWGTDNKLPETVVKYVEDSEIVGKVLEYLIDTAYGEGIMPCKVEIDADGNKKYSPIELKGDARAFFDNNDINQYLKGALTNIFYFNRAMAEVVMDKQPTARKAVLLMCKDTSFARMEDPNDDGEIERVAFFGSWGWIAPTKENIVVMPMLSIDLPKRDLLTRMGKIANREGKKKDEKEARYIYPMSILKPTKREYPQPAWWAIFKSGWYDFMMAIPQFKKALMKNQMMVKYIVYLDSNYFIDIFKEEKIKDEKAMKARVTLELTNLNTFLTNAENTGKSILGKITYDPMGKGDVRKNIIIDVLPNNFKGGEYLEDSQEVSKIVGTSLGVNLNMIGDIPGKTGNMSGSDVRERFIILNAQMKSIRDLVLQPLYAIKQLNGWDEKLEFTIPNIRLTTTDKNTGATKDVGAPPM